MVKYLSKGSCSPMLVLMVLMTMVLASKVPVPSCNAPRINLQDLPISLQETQTYRMDDLFTGYNLNFSIPSKPSFVGIRPKLLQTAGVAKPMPGLKNYHFGHRGNQWGNTLVTISVVNGSTIINWGASSAPGEVPDLTNKVILENDTSVQCFDAVWLRAEMLIMVDCVQKSSTIGIGLTNYFYYINSTTKATLGKVKNDMYVGFTTITHRKIALHMEDGMTYLIRAYFAEYIDQVHRHNTYAEIISLSNPMKPWTIRVMDRSFLHQDKLSITDFQVYLGDIYILDYFSGVIKFDISPQQTIVIVGRYRTDSGYTKLGVYSNNLDNEFLFVLAHNHSIIEVDWTNQIQPQIVTKYSIPDNSQIADLWVNEQYVVVQLTANLTNEKQQEITYQSTYVLTRGSRTYTNAYVAIPHISDAFVDLNRDTNQILTIDALGLYIYHLSSPVVTINPTSQDLLNKEVSFVVKAESKNEYDPSSALICTFTFRFIVVPVDSLALWPTGRTLPRDYYANYPGQLFIPIDRYVFGGNITYGLYFNKSEEDPPTYFFLQQNSTIITWWDKPPSVFKYTFVRTQQFDSTAETQINIYTQDANNVTHFSRCAVVPFTDEVHCFESTNVPHINYKVVNLTASRFHYYQGNYLHLAAIVYEALPNEVFLYHVEEEGDMRMPPIMFPDGYEGKIQNIQFLGHYLAVVLRYTKEIVLYDMIQCEDYLPNPCKEVYRINTTMMTKIGVNYFSPMDVYTSDFHPFVLFVQCLDRVVILDITRQGPILLAEVQSPASQEPGFYKWKMAIAKGELILVNPPFAIEQHDLDELYVSSDVPFTRVYPTYGYQIQDRFDLDFSDSGNLIYITAIDKKLPEGQNSVIMVYRTGYPAVSSFYDVFHLNTRYDDLIIDATGNFGDYITVAFGSKLMMFRQYEIPILVFEDVFGDFNFNLTFTNDPQQRYYYLSRSSIHTANYPEDIIINSTDLNKTDFLSATSDISNTSAVYSLEDGSWFNGSVINYTLEGENCNECNQKMKVRNHIQEQRIVLGVHDMEDYTFSLDGGYIQQFQSILKMRHNGSIHQFVSLPSVFDGENCLYIQHSWIYDYTLSACKLEENGGEVYLYTTFNTASKPFVSGPYYSSAKHVVSMHVMEELMIIVDVDENPYRFNREGGVIIYAMNHDPFEPQIFDELEFIDTNDLTAANDWPGGPCFIGNAQFSFTNQTGVYRLIISELRNGLFVVDFKWTKGRKSVEILKVEFIDLAEELVKLHLPLPNMAFFTAVAINKEYYDATFNYWQTEVIVATSNFHSFLINLHIDKTGTVVSHEISRVFYRYGFYEAENYIKAFDGYFAIGQRLPTIMKVFPWYSRLVLTVYDTRERWVFNQKTGKQEKSENFLAGTNIPVSYILGGYTMNEGDVTFDWNVTLTRNRTDPFRNIGLLALHNFDARIWQFSVNERLSIITEAGIETNQKGFLVARNDYHSVKIPLSLVINGSSGGDGLAGWAIALIVIGSLAVVGGLGYVLFIRGKGKAPNRESEAEKSLLERQADEEQKDQDDDDDEEGQEGSEDGEEEEDGQEEPHKEQPAKVSSTEANESEVRPANDASINRETISSVGEQQRPPAEQQPRPAQQGEPREE